MRQGDPDVSGGGDRAPWLHTAFAACVSLLLTSAAIAATFTINSSDAAGDLAPVGSWVSHGSPGKVDTLAVDPTNAQSVYAGIGRRRVPDSTSDPACVGDCDGGEQVTVDEILTMVNIALGNAPLSSCTAGNANGDRSRWMRSSRR